VRVWTGAIDQVPSGRLDLGHLSRDTAALCQVAKNLVSQKSENRRKIWRASVKDESNQWLLIALGKASADEDEDEWVPGSGWVFRGHKSKHACKVLLDKQSKRILIERNDRVSQSPFTIANQLQKLLQKSLDEIDPDASWVINVRIDVDATPFRESLYEFEAVHQFEVWLSLPNASLHDELNELLGVTKDAGAEDVSIGLDSKRGIDRKSRFVRGALELIGRGVRRIRAKGRTGEDEYKNVYSDQLSTPVEKRVDDESAGFSVDSADSLSESIGVDRDRE